MGNFGENTGKAGRPPGEYSSNFTKEAMDTPMDEGYSFGNTRLVKNKSGLEIIHPVYYQIGSFDNLFPLQYRPRNEESAGLS